MRFTHLASSLAVVAAANWGPIKEDVDFLLNNIIDPWTTPPQADNAEGCKPLCEADQRCSGFTWYQGSCWLKYGNPQLVAKAGAHSAGMRPAECLPFEKNVDYWGNDIECIDGITTPDACCNACTANPNCKLYVVDNQHCCLKTAAADRRPDQDPSLNIYAAFVRTFVIGGGPGVSISDGSYSPDVRVPNVKFSTAEGSQWLPGIQYEKAGAKPEFATIVEKVNTTVAAHQHGQPPDAKAILGTDGATIRGFWSVNSVGECAALISLHGASLFTYSPRDEMCLSHVYPTSSTTTYFLTSTGSFTGIKQTLPSTYQISTSTANSKSACQTTCTSNSYCTAYVLNGKQCTLYAPAQGKTGDGADDSVAGWINTAFSTKINSKLPTYGNNPSTVRFYTTAHQDDHELFMSNSYHEAITDSNTKVVFIYTSAGDAGIGQSWRLARQQGTVAATTAWVDHAGLFSSKKITDTVTVAGHHITRVKVGNVFHYFLCIREDPGNDENGVYQLGLLNLLYNGQAVPPMDLPNEIYYTRDDFADVLRGIYHLESDGVANVEIHSQDEQNGSGDHPLHLATGNLVQEVVDSDIWSTCADQVYYFDYDVFYWDVNLDEPVYSLQRYAWMWQSKAILDAYGEENWSVHAWNLGRTYPNHQYGKVEDCPTDNKKLRR
ncbi:hypothetical protein AC1031_013545 [Aphanomyces cochlioides]|nr:hypothetical protein AC1031_013545 [Aphanomyces cochlioides]